MRINSNLVLTGERAVLVPYRKEHVEQYHDWMKSPELLEATASEPLSLEEEFNMQQSWREDNDKCTFIVLDRELPDTPGTGQHGGGMVGDVNLFLNDPEDPKAGEIDIMIADSRSRRKGLATEVLKLFMVFCVEVLGVELFRARIGEANAASLALFAKLGYKEVGRSEVWKEVTLELPVSESSMPWLGEVDYESIKGVYDADGEGEAAA